jgi:ABC-type proline/glycine betaine transport system permease subunit
MLKNFIKGILSAIVIKVLDNYRHLSIRLLKIEAAKFYLQGVRIARLSALGVAGLGLLIGLMAMGAVLFHVGLFILLPWCVEAKALLAMLLGLVYVATGGLALRAAMNEKVWMEKSGAADMLNDALDRARKD